MRLISAVARYIKPLDHVNLSPIFRFVVLNASCTMWAIFGWANDRATLSVCADDPGCDNAMTIRAAPNPSSELQRTTEKKETTAVGTHLAKFTIKHRHISRKLPSEGRTKAV